MRRRRAIAANLVKELRRAEGSLTPYDATAVAEVVAEIRALWDQIQENEEEEDGGEMAVAQLTMMREKRCTLAYLRGRMGLLRQARWELGAALPTELRERMSVEERDFFAGYSRAVARYTTAIGVDVARDVDSPPKDLFVEVRGTTTASSTAAAAEAYTESGPVSLDSSTVQYVRKDATVESLLRQGVLEQL